MNLIKIRYVLMILLKFLASLMSVDNVKACLADERGGLVLGFGGIDVEDKDWIRYRLLKVDESLNPIRPCDLPDYFCDEACRIVDEFRRKTVNEKIEWMLYFDYMAGEVIYCWQGDFGKSGGEFKRKYLKGKHIASIHNHTLGYYSFPSPDNFDILENDFEDCEIITSIRAFWIVEFKEVFAGKLDKIFKLILEKICMIIY